MPRLGIDGAFGREGGRGGAVMGAAPFHEEDAGKRRRDRADMAQRLRATAQCFDRAGADVQD